MTELERMLRQELDHAYQAYLGFVHGGIQTTPAEEPTVTVSRAETIEAFCRIHHASEGLKNYLLDNYAGAAPVVVQQSWWELVSEE